VAFDFARAVVALEADRFAALRGTDKRAPGQPPSPRRGRIGKEFPRFTIGALQNEEKFDTRWLDEIAGPMPQVA
jgi:hypothetical protein